ncbi:hypothetical protein [Melittangium boletus]|uniref:hypothetical protein n=1 Tax=Melittangium boletus TaxID=83453 RepID=UPI003DA4776C
MPPPPPPLKPGFVLLCALAAVHLLLVLVGAAHVRLFPATSTPHQLHMAYGAWTGATSGYAFFAPGISQAHRISVDLTLPSGEVVHEPFRFSNDSLDIRAYSMALRFSAWNRKADYQDNLARAWAATMFGRHPEARQATVRVEKMELPSMEAYRAGERPSWTELYRADLALRPTPSSARASLP